VRAQFKIRTQLRQGEIDPVQAGSNFIVLLISHQKSFTFYKDFIMRYRLWKF